MAQGEFELIEKFFLPLTVGHPGALGLKDDAALLDVPSGYQLVVTADALVAGVHFLADDPPGRIGQKILRVNLSDLAAMGARPMGAFLTACFTRGTSEAWLEEFAAGLKRDVEEFSCPILGGDTVATPGPASFSLTAMGAVEKGRALKRSAAKIGDLICLSGTIGDAVLGLRLLMGRCSEGISEKHSAFLIDRYHLPQPRVGLGPKLIGLANAAMDISDGLVGDLEHICKASGVGARIEADKIPLSPAAQAGIASGLAKLEELITGGDDYELLFAIPESRSFQLEALAKEGDILLTVIGSIIDGQGVEVIDRSGRPMTFGSQGYRHFR
jgi:thiamine-monophosphate kinase